MLLRILTFFWVLLAEFPTDYAKLVYIYTSEYSYMRKVTIGGVFTMAAT